MKGQPPHEERTAQSSNGPSRQRGTPQESSSPPLLCPGLGWMLPHPHVLDTLILVNYVFWLQVGLGLGTSVYPESNLPALVR